MPLTKSDVHVDQVLTTISGAYKNRMFVGTEIMPVVPVPKDSDKFYTYGREIFTSGAYDRHIWEDGDDWNFIDYTLGTETYSCVQHAYASKVTEKIVRNSDDPLRPFEDAAEFTRDRLLLILEREIASKVTTQGNYPSGLRTQLSGTAQWSDFTGTSDPHNIIITGAEAMRLQSGVYPNLLWMSAAVWAKVIQHPSIISILRNTENRLATMNDLITHFAGVGIERVVIAGAVNNTAREGATEVMANVWGKHAGLVYVPPRPGIKQPAFGYTFSSVPFQTDRVALAGKRATVVNNVMSWDLEFICRDSSEDALAGYLIEDAVA